MQILGQVLAKCLALERRWSPVAHVTICPERHLPNRAVEPISGSNVIPRRARPGLSGLVPHDYPHGPAQDDWPGWHLARTPHECKYHSWECCDVPQRAFVEIERVIQGHLAHEKMPTPLGPLQGPR